MKSYYEILGVEENASQEEIKSRYKKLALKMHPDRLIGAGKSEKEIENIQKQFQEITNAYQVLSDENQRKKYDEQMRSSSFFNEGGSWSSHSSGFEDSSWSFDDIFESFFGGSNRRSSSGHYSKSSSSYANKPETVNVSLIISFKDSLFGSVKKFNLNLLRGCLRCSKTGAYSKDNIIICNQCKGRGVIDVLRRSFLGSVRNQMECNKCDGSGKVITKKCNTCNGAKIVSSSEVIEVSIPRGMKVGQKIIMRNKGNDGLGIDRGDIVIEIKVKNHNIFQRKNNDIHCTVPISFIDAILGNNIDVITFDGVEEIKVPECSQIGDHFILGGKGFYTEIGKSARGDFYVWFDIKLPRKISSDTKKIFNNIYEKTEWNPNKDFIKKNKGILED